MESFKSLERSYNWRLVTPVPGCKNFHSHESDPLQPYQQHSYQQHSCQQQSSQQHSYRQHSCQQHSYQQHSNQQHSYQQHSCQQHSCQQHFCQQHSCQQHSYQQHSCQQHSSFSESSRIGVDAKSETIAIASNNEISPPIFKSSENGRCNFPKKSALKLQLSVGWSLIQIGVQLHFLKVQLKCFIDVVRLRFDSSSKVGENIEWK